MKRYGLFILVVFALAACANAALPTASPIDAPRSTAPDAQPTTLAQTSPLAVPTVQSPLPAPTPTDGRAAIFPNTIIVYQREGGIAGESQKWTFYSTGRIVAGDGTEWQVPADQVKPLFELAESPDFGNLSDNYPAAGTCADCYTHTLTVFGPSDPQTVTFTEGANAPAPLPQMLDEINQVLAK